ncbi:MAG: YdeI/OmpD-associated family protein [Pyrinomonadaceae bacterium]
MPGTLDLPVLEFKTLAAWEKWLAKNHDSSPGVWMRVFKKASGIKSIEIKEALDGALCFGWIDGQRNSYDEFSYLQKYTQRRAKSIWSKVNVTNVARLIETGKMQPAGHAQIEAAKADGRWAQAYDSVKEMQVPEDFLKELRKDKKALAFFETLNSQNRYAIGFRLQTAKKPETRERRLKLFIQMMKNGEKFH